MISVCRGSEKREGWISLFAGNCVDWTAQKRLRDRKSGKPKQRQRSMSFALSVILKLLLGEGLLFFINVISTNSHHCLRVLWSITCERNCSYFPIPTSHSVKIVLIMSYLGNCCNLLLYIVVILLYCSKKSTI